MTNDLEYPTHIVVARSKSYGELFQAINALPKDFEVLELFPVGKGGHLMLEVLSDENAETSYSQWRNEAVKVGVQFQEIDLFQNVSPKILDAYLSMNTPSELAGSLLVLESFSLNQIFKAAVKLVADGSEIFDFRFLRGSEPRAFCFVTNVKGKIDEMSGVEQTFIAQASEPVKNYFQSVRRLSEI